MISPRYRSLSCLNIRNAAKDWTFQNDKTTYNHLHIFIIHYQLGINQSLSFSCLTQRDTLKSEDSSGVQTMQIPDRAAELLTQRKRNEKESATVFHSEFRLHRQDYH